MRIKGVLLIFLLGLIAGITVSPFTNKTPSQAFLSPISVSLADTEGLTLPTSQREVLGTSIKTAPTPIPAPEDVGHFRDIIAQEIKTSGLDGQTDRKQSNTEDAEPPETTENIQSNYSGRATIAVLGDSMTDVMGPNLPYLKKELLKYYPKADFNLLNYGVGAENIEMGLNRMGGEYTYQGRHYPALISINPDIVIVESFGYNPFSDANDYLNKHWSTLAQIVDRVKNQTNAKIMILSTIAPSKSQFGEGPAGVNWPKDLAWQHAIRIHEYLDNAVRFAYSAGLPLINVYHKTLLSNGEGNPAYINPGDHIHQNVAGNEFISRLIAQKISQLNFIP